MDLDTATGRTDTGVGPDAGLRWAGAAGIAFAVIVIAQNALRAGAPANDASTADVVRYFHDHRGLEWFLVVTFVVSGVAIARWTGGLWQVVTARAPEARDWLVTGFLGVVGIVAIFASMVSCEVGLVVASRDASRASTVVPTLWTLHNSLFAILNLLLAIALLGLSRAAVRAGAAPRAFAVISVAGAVLHAIGACFAPALAEKASPAMAFSGVGFVCWLAFLIASGWRMMHLHDGAR